MLQFMQSLIESLNTQKAHTEAELQVRTSLFYLHHTIRMSNTRLLIGSLQRR